MSYLKKKIKLIKFFLVNIFILIVGLLFLNELVEGYISKPIELSDRKINLREHKPNLDISFTNEDQSREFKYAKYKTNKFITDENGFIIGNLEDNLVKEIDFYFIGGSTTQCLYVDSEKRFPFLVQQKLSNNFNKPIKCVNAGVGGSHMYHSIVSFLAKGIDKKPKYLVIMNLVNDISLLQYSGIYHSNIPSRKLINITFGHSDVSVEMKYDGLIGYIRKIKDNYFPHLWLFLKQQINFNNKFSFLTKKIKEKDKVNTYMDEFKDFRKNKFNNHEILDEYSKSLTTLINICKANQIKPILMTQFNLIESRHPIWIEHFNKYFDNALDWKTRNIENYIDLYTTGNQIIRDVSLKENIPLIDLANKIPANPELMFDGIHLTDKGSVLVSEIIFDFITNKLKEEFMN
jgi:lysophospholipase L1-like esterase